MTSMIPVQGYTGIVELIGSNPIQAWIFFFGLLFTTAQILFITAKIAFIFVCLETCKTTKAEIWKLYGSQNLNLVPKSKKLGSGKPI